MSTEQHPAPIPASDPLPRSEFGDPTPPSDAYPAADEYPVATGAEPPLTQAPLEPAADIPPAAAAPTQAAPAQPLKIKRTRISGLWVAVGFFAVVLLLLLIFILQNGTTVQVSYMGAHGHLPLGVALLLSAVCGVILVVLAGAARISQLRAVARRHRRADTRQAKAEAKAESKAAAPR
jgi:uncharacterized integral membrane protein